MDEQNDFPYFATRLRQARAAQRFSLARLAREAGISKTYLWELETDTERGKSPSASVVFRLSRVLGLGMEELLGLPPGEPRSEEPNRVQLGWIEFHSERSNPGLIERFYAVRDDLTDASCIVDLWLLDIARVLAEFGYDMRVYRTPEKQMEHEERALMEKDRRRKR